MKSNHTYLTVMTIISSERWVDKSKLPKEDEGQLEESSFKQTNTGISRYPRPKEVIMKMVMRDVVIKTEEKGKSYLLYYMQESWGKLPRAGTSSFILKATNQGFDPAYSFRTCRPMRIEINAIVRVRPHATSHSAPVKLDCRQTRPCQLRTRPI